MKYGQLYTQLTKNPREDSPPSKTKEVDAARFQALISWQQSTITQEVIKDLHEQIGTLLDDSVRLAISNPSNFKIIQNLIRVDTLKQQLDKYVTTT